MATADDARSLGAMYREFAAWAPDIRHRWNLPHENVDPNIDRALKKLDQYWRAWPSPLRFLLLQTVEAFRAAEKSANTPPDDDQLKTYQRLGVKAARWAAKWPVGEPARHAAARFAFEMLDACVIQESYIAAGLAIEKLRDLDALTAQHGRKPVPRALIAVLVFPDRIDSLREDTIRRYRPRLRASSVDRGWRRNFLLMCRIFPLTRRDV